MSSLCKDLGEGASESTDISSAIGNNHKKSKKKLLFCESSSKIPRNSKPNHTFTSKESIFDTDLEEPCFQRGYETVPGTHLSSAVAKSQ